MIGSSTTQEIERVIEPGGASDDIVSDQDIPSHECLSACCQPHGFIRYFMLPFFMCSLSFSIYFCYDNPAALEGRFKSDLNITVTEFTTMNSVCAWPNVILCLIGGYLIDRVFGVRLGTKIYVIITLLGQLIVASGAVLNIYWLVLLGRFVFGIGAESVAVVQNNYTVRWFKGKELSIVFGIQLGFAGVGSVVNFMVMEPTYIWLDNFYDGYTCLGIVQFIAASPFLLTTVCYLVLVFMESHAEKNLHSNETGTTIKVVSLRDVKDFRFTFWLVCIIYVMYYVTLYPFSNIATGFFKEKFNCDDIEASRVNGLMYMISVFASPPFCYLIHFTGMKILWIFIAISGTITAHALLAFTSFSPYAGMVLMGMFYSIIASNLLPLVSLIIPEHQWGTAYGVCQAVQNLGLAVIFILVGLIIDKFGYQLLQIFFISCLMVALIATLLLWMVDKNQGSVLNVTARNKKIHRKTVQSEKLLMENHTELM